jgi:hypothetical protein
MPQTQSGGPELEPQDRYLAYESPRSIPDARVRFKDHFVIPVVLRSARFVPRQGPGRREPARVTSGAFRAAGLPVPTTPGSSTPTS